MSTLLEVSASVNTVSTFSSLSDDAKATFVAYMVERTGIDSAEFYGSYPEMDEEFQTDYASYLENTAVPTVANLSADSASPEVNGLTAKERAETDAWKLLVSITDPTAEPTIAPVSPLTAEQAANVNEQANPAPPEQTGPTVAELVERVKKQEGELIAFVADAVRSNADRSWMIGERCLDYQIARKEAFTGTYTVKDFATGMTRIFDEVRALIFIKPNSIRLTEWTIAYKLRSMVSEAIGQGLYRFLCQRVWAWVVLVIFCRSVVGDPRTGRRSGSTPPSSP